jgi:hypothetical protein
LIVMKWTRDGDTQKAIEASLSVVHALHRLEWAFASAGSDPVPPIDAYLWNGDGI